MTSSTSLHGRPLMQDWGDRHPFLFCLTVVVGFAAFVTAWNFLLPGARERTWRLTFARTMPERSGGIMFALVGLRGLGRLSRRGAIFALAASTVVIVLVSSILLGEQSSRRVIARSAVMLLFTLPASAGVFFVLAGIADRRRAAGRAEDRKDSA